jgi:hypothetical protein
MLEGWVQVGFGPPPPPNFNVSTEREKNFWRIFETMEGLCHVMPVMKPNTGTDDGGDGSWQGEGK